MLLNPGVFEFKGRTWLLLRVAERPVQTEGQISFPIYNQQGSIEIIRFDKSDTNLDFTDPQDVESGQYNVLARSR